MRARAGASECWTRHGVRRGRCMPFTTAPTLACQVRSDAVITRSVGSGHPVGRPARQHVEDEADERGCPQMEACGPERVDSGRQVGDQERQSQQEPQHRHEAALGPALSRSRVLQEAAHGHPTHQGEHTEPDDPDDRHRRSSLHSEAQLPKPSRSPAGPAANGHATGRHAFSCASDVTDVVVSRSPPTSGRRPDPAGT